MKRSMEIPLGMKFPEAMRPFMTAYFRGDAQAMADCFAPEAELWRIHEVEPLTGRDAILAWLEGFIQQFKQASLHRMKWFASHNAILSVSELTVELGLLGRGSGSWPWPPAMNWTRRASFEGFAPSSTSKAPSE